MARGDTNIVVSNEVYSYELKYASVWFNYQADAVLKFPYNAILYVYKNGTLVETYGKDSLGGSIADYLASKGATVTDATGSQVGWEIDNIVLGEHEDFFKQDGAIEIVYYIPTTQKINGATTVQLLSITQLVYVSYAVVDFEEPSNLLVGSLESPIFLNPSITLNVENFKSLCKVYWHSNGASASTVEQLSNDSLTFALSKTTFSSTDDYFDDNTVDAVVRNKITISSDNSWHTFTDQKLFDLYLTTQNKVLYYSISGEDTNIYYYERTEQNTFKAPTFIVEKHLTDGSTQQVSDYYFLDDNGNVLEVDDTTSTSYIILCVPNQYGSDELFDAQGNDLSYSLNYVADTIVSVAFKTFNVVYGRTLKQYEENNDKVINNDTDADVDWISFKVTWKSGYESDIGNFKFTSLNKESPILERFTESTLEISIVGDDYLTKYKLATEYDVSTSNISYVTPNVSKITFDSDYSNIALYNLTSFCIKKIYVHYELTDYVAEYSLGNTPSTSVFKISDAEHHLEEIGYYNGLRIVDYNPANDEQTITFNFVDTITNENKAVNGTVYVYDKIDFKEWGITNINSTYSIGDKFLTTEQDAKTMIEITTTTSNISIPIARAINAKIIATNFPVGYEFKRANNYSVSVSSSFDTKTIEYPISVSASTNLNTSTKQINLVAVWKESIDTIADGNKLETITYDDGVWVLVDMDCTAVDENGYRKLRKGCENVNPVFYENVATYFYPEYVYGYLTDVFDTNKLSKVILFKDPVNPVNAQNNMVVKFPCYVEGNADYINKSTFGIMFGSNNSNNRLFVSGNKKYPNIDWHTGDITSSFNDAIDNENENNLTYFADTSYQIYGSSDNAVIGYDIVSDDRLLVLKTKSDKEKTVYFREPTTMAKYQNNGEQGDVYEEVFTTTKGNNSVAGINPHSITNFNGDTLFVDSDSTVQGLDLTGIVGDKQRYANTRSLFINRVLRQYDLQDTILWTNQKYLYLTIKDLGVFVTHYETKDSGQYEWWLINYDNPTAFIEINGIVYYGNDKGEFFKIAKSFQDIHKVFIRKGQGLELAKIKPDFEQIVLDKNLLENIKIGDYFKHYVDKSDYRNNIYQQICHISSDDGLIINKDRNCLLLPKELWGKVREGVVYFLNTDIELGNIEINGEGFNFGDEITFKFIDDDNLQMYVNNVLADLTKLNSANLCRRIDTDVEISAVDKENGLITLKNTDIVKYGCQDISIPLFKGEISHIDNVDAYFITAPLLPSISYTKTLWQFTLTNDSGLPSQLSVAIANNKLPKKENSADKEVSFATDGLNLNEISFSKMDFQDIEIPRVYTRHYVMPNLKFVCFALKNDSDTNCILTSMAIAYTIPFPQV